MEGSGCIYSLGEAQVSTINVMAGWIFFRLDPHTILLFFLEKSDSTLNLKNKF